MAVCFLRKVIVSVSTTCHCPHIHLITYAGFFLCVLKVSLSKQTTGVFFNVCCLCFFFNMAQNGEVSLLEQERSVYLKPFSEKRFIS